MHSTRKFLALGTALLSALILIPAAAHSQTPSLPAGWTSADVGTPALAGSATQAGNILTVQGAGSGIQSAADQFHFVYRPVEGDIDMSVRVANLQTSTGQAGLMIRESLDAGAPTAVASVRAGQNVAFQSRMRSDRKISIAPGPVAAGAVWLRLVRQGRTIRAYTSPDGSAWTLLNSANVTMNASALIGVVVTSHDASEFASATFTSPEFGTPTAPQPTLPAPWTSSDIGNPAIAGAATSTDGVFTVKGSGVDIWDAADQFRFVYQAVTGDTQIVARVASLQAADPWGKAGVMIRSGLTAGAANVALFATVANGWSFQRRLYDDGLTVSTRQAGAAPGWVRLVREGQLISAYHSSDGSNWTLFGTDTLQMTDAVYVGFAVTSHNAAATAIGTFSNAVVSAPTNTNTPPTVSIASPAASATFTAPANITISAAASDSDGLVRDVKFFANGTMIGTATTAPFTISWANVAAGVYSLTAVAADNGGGTATSPAVRLTVGAAPAPVTTSRVTFTPSVDYATNVTSVAVELRRATDPVTAVAVATRNLGKPAASGSDITVDISTLVDPLPSGSYYAIIVATGPGGTTGSSPSPAFNK